MANESKRLKPAQIEADRATFAALQAMPGYKPANPAYAVDAVTKAHADLLSAQAAEAQASAAAAAARDEAAKREWELHNLVLGAKDQVVAQFGRNSNEVQALGLKKASEYKAPRRKSKKGPDEK